MAKPRKPVLKEPDESSSNETRKDETIAQKYSGRPSPRALFEEGQIDRRAYERAEAVRVSGPPERPFHELIVALRAERERQGLSLADLAERTGMDRSAIHKIEIGLNRNPTFATLSRYASALGTRIEWHLEMIEPGQPSKA
jgi:ribosome-binding protein aMBF1 (putative translation factor)